METRVATQHELVSICMQELCAKAGFTNCNGLVQRDLEFICDSIESATGVMISLSTMKRLFNGQFTRQPQIATLNAMTAYIGYQSWQDFKRAKLNLPITLKFDSKFETQSSEPIKRRVAISKYVLISAALIFTAIALFAFLKFNKPKPGSFENAMFTMNKTTVNDLPNTVVFNYDVENVVADSFFIQQSWDKDRRVRIDPKKHTLTDLYYEPGYHVAKLIANEQVIKTIDVSIPTDRWFYYARERKPASIPEYVTVQNYHDGSLSMTAGEVSNSGIDIRKENIYLQVFFPTKIESSSDNYIFKCRARITEVRNNFCPFLMCEIFCQRNFMFFKSVPKGCTSEAKAQFGENIMNGKTHDLSALGANMNDWHIVEIIVRNKNVTIRIDNKEVLSTKYTESSGLITGLGFLSNGLPDIDFISLETLDGKDIYQNEFESNKN